MRSAIHDVFGDPAEVLALADSPIPEPGPGQVRIKVIQVGVCGTDLHIHNGEFMTAYPLTPGHEVVGTVAAIGKNVKNLKAGQRWVLCAVAG